VLVGATAWCTHPADLDVARIGGTKNPDVPAIVALAPDVVVANAEENREVDRAALRDAGLTVHVTDIRTLDAASPFGRVCTPEDVAAVVRSLVDPACAYVTDQRVVVDGGTF
jgi:NAD(P)-dependent dehydrogenase (short-subunit alcohol dehydrogenase family)